MLTKEEHALRTRRAFMSFLAASPVMLAATRVLGQPKVDLDNIYAPEILTRAPRLDFGQLAFETVCFASVDGHPLSGAARQKKTRWKRTLPPN